MSLLNKNTKAVVLVLGLVAVFALYFFGETVPDEVKEVASTEQHEDRDHEMVDDATLLENAYNNLSAEDKLVIDAATDNEAKSQAWFSIDQYTAAALLAEDHAEATKIAEDWNHAGDKLVRAYRSTEDAATAPYFLEKAVNAYKEALASKPDNTTRIKLAKIYTDLYGLTMDGVLLLREVVADDPNHVQANFELGVLSVKSGQLDKAIERFNKVITVEPSVIQAYTWKAQVLLEQKKNSGAVTVLKEGISIANDEKTKAGLQEIIDDIVI